MPKRAVVYARVSSVYQGENYSLESQIEACLQYGEIHGLQVMAQFTDTVSGVTLKRPGLEALLEMVRTDQIDVLLVYTADRLSRSVADFYLIKDELLRHGVECEAVSGPRWEEADSGSQMFDGEISYAEYERNKMLERFERGRMKKVKSNKILGNGIRPYGYEFIKVQGRYRLETVGLRIVEEEAKIIKLIYEWYLNGDNGQKMTIANILDKINNMDIPTYADTTKFLHIKRRSSMQWSKGTIYHILRNPLYKGMYNHNIAANYNENQASIEEINIIIPAIIDLNDWNEACRRRLSNTRPKYNYKKCLLSGRVKCSCGYRRYIQSTKNYDYCVYQCHGYRSSYSVNKCPLPRFYVTDTDNAVWFWIDSLINEEFVNKVTIENDVQNIENHSRVQVLNKALATIKDKELRSLDLYLEGIIDKITFLNIKKACRQEQIEISKSISILNNEILRKALSKDQECILRKAILEKQKKCELDIEDKIEIVKILQIEVTLYMEDDNPKAHIECALLRKVGDVSIYKR
jgi:site-specific DNA recombinase